MKKKLLTIIVVALAIIIAMFFSLKNSKNITLTSVCGTYDTKQIEINNKIIKTFISDDDCKKELGLAAVNNLQNDQGMLFVFDKSGKYGFWMKDMKFPIDILWIDENFSIVGIEKNVATSTYPQVFGQNFIAEYVLEAPSGFSDENSVLVGNKIKIF
jgi:uncharacterized membrane protein (UPF0127 family)